jgi:hypothetical protein
MLLLLARDEPNIWQPSELPLPSLLFRQLYSLALRAGGILLHGPSSVGPLLICEKGRRACRRGRLKVLFRSERWKIVDGLLAN